MFLCYLVVILYFFLLLLHDSTSWHVYLKAHTFCFWVKRWSLSYSVTISIYWCWQSSSKNRKLIKAFMKALPSISILIASVAVVELTIWVVSLCLLDFIHIAIYIGKFVLFPLFPSHEQACSASEHYLWLLIIILCCVLILQAVHDFTLYIINALRLCYLSIK